MGRFVLIRKLGSASQKVDFSLMIEGTMSNQIIFRYLCVDSATGVTNATVKRLAAQLGVDENQVIHSALHDLAVKLLPQYEADDGHLTNVQLRQIKKSVLQGGLCSVRSRLGCG